MDNKKIKMVKKKIVADCLTPVSVYGKFRENPYSFLLESVERAKTGRYSFVGISAAKVYELYYDSIKVLFRTESGFVDCEVIKTDKPLDTLGSIIEEYSMVNDSVLPFSGGLVGYANYEIISSWEKIEFSNKADNNEPIGVYLFTDEFVAFDHLFNTAEIVKLLVQENNSTDISAARSRLDELNSRIIDPELSLPEILLESRKDIFPDSNFSKEEFEQSVRNIKEDIVAGEIIQGVVSQRLEVPMNAEPFNYYRALRIINPSPYMFYMSIGSVILCGSSPEVLVRLEGTQAMVRPIAGTRPRSEDIEKEQALADELKTDEKEKAEHIMLVDLGRNDLGRVCQSGSVRVRSLMDIEKYSHVMHMVSDVIGKILPGITAIDVFKACFPAGTVSGAPKLRAIEIIDREENDLRGVYAGSVGYFSFNGNMDMCIAIRTMLIKSGKIYVQAGAGIVYDSIPENEYIETLNKAGALLEAVRLAENENLLEGE